MHDKILELINQNPQIIKLGLERTYKLFQACGNPQKDVSSVQVVGTNGKGSVSAMLSNIFVQNGLKVGLYTSPHLIKFNERIQIDFSPITDKEIKGFIAKYKHSINKEEATFFELTTVMALWHFKNKQVDIAILETGLGGRLDSVTACHASGLIITSISNDHNKILGPSIKEIAQEKAGAILPTTNFILSANQDQKIKSILNKSAEKINTNIQYVRKNFLKKNKFIYLHGEHQEHNGSLTYEAAKKISNYFKFKINNKQLIKHITTSYWPGRMQVIQKQPTIIFDVCHNEAGLYACIKYFQTRKTLYNKKYIIAAFEENKNIYVGFSKLIDLFDNIIITETKIRKSMQSRLFVKKLQASNVVAIPDINKALISTIQKLSKNDLLFILGSHFIGPYMSKIFKNCFAIDNKEVITCSRSTTK